MAGTTQTSTTNPPLSQNNTNESGSPTQSNHTSDTEEIKEYEIIRRIDRPRFVPQRGLMLCFDFNVDRVPAVRYNHWNCGSTVVSYFDPDQGNGGRVYFRNNRQVCQIITFD